MHPRVSAESTQLFLWQWLSREKKCHITTAAFRGTLKCSLRISRHLWAHRIPQKEHCRFSFFCMWRSSLPKVLYPMKYPWPKVGQCQHWYQYTGPMHQLGVTAQRQPVHLHSKPWKTALQGSPWTTLGKDGARTTEINDWGVFYVWINVVFKKLQAELYSIKSAYKKSFAYLSTKYSP